MIMIHYVYLTILYVERERGRGGKRTWERIMEKKWGKELSGMECGNARKMKKKEGEEVASLANLKAKAETFGEPFRSANLWIPEGTKVHENNLSYWIPVPWDTREGRVLLAGDAGHPMTFQRGQGLNQGIADARSLVMKYKDAAAGKMTFKEAAAAYQAEMVDRAGDEVRLSKENTEMLHDWERMANSPIMARGGHPRGQNPDQAK